MQVIYVMEVGYIKATSDPVPVIRPEINTVVMVAL